MGITRLDQDYVRVIADEVKRLVKENGYYTIVICESLISADEILPVDLDTLQKAIRRCVDCWRTKWEVADIDIILMNYYYGELQEVLRHAEL